jgi:hypothetical protein
MYHRAICWQLATHKTRLRSLGCVQKTSQIAGNSGAAGFRPALSSSRDLQYLSCVDRVRSATPRNAADKLHWEEFFYRRRSVRREHLTLASPVFGRLACGRTNQDPGVRSNSRWMVTVAGAPNSAKSDANQRVSSVSREPSIYSVNTPVHRLVYCYR